MTMPAILISIHIGAGVLGLSSGAVALLSRKGAPLHRASGNVFFVSMLIMAGLGAYGSLYEPVVMIDFLSGALTFYLVATGWVTVTRRAVSTRSFHIVASVVAFAIGIAFLANGIEAANTETGMKDDSYAGLYFFFGSVALLAGGSDLRTIARGGLSGVSRISRHLWRMCFALFIAAGSLFLGQQDVFPEPLRGTLILATPVIAVILLSFYWAARVRFPKPYRAPQPNEAA